MARKTIQQGSKNHETLCKKANKVRTFAFHIVEGEGESDNPREDTLRYARKLGLKPDHAAQVTAHLFTKDGTYDPLDGIPF